MGNERNTNDAGILASTGGLFAWGAAFVCIYEVIGPKEGFDVRQLVTFYLTYKGADFVGNSVFNYLKGGSK